MSSHQQSSDLRAARTVNKKKKKEQTTMSVAESNSKITQHLVELTLEDADAPRVRIRDITSYIDSRVQLYGWVHRQRTQRM